MTREKDCHEELTRYLDNDKKKSAEEIWEKQFSRKKKTFDKNYS